MLLSLDLENIRVTIGDSFYKTMELMRERIKNKPDSIKTQDLISYVGLLLPYVAEKKAVVGVKKDNEPMSRESFAKMMIDKIAACNLEIAKKQGDC